MGDENSAQLRFDEKYITSTEIGERLGVERSSILYRRRQGFLPNVIKVKGVKAFLWERALIEPHLNAWHTMLKARRHELT